mgnify:FL=1
MKIMSLQTFFLHAAQSLQRLGALFGSAMCPAFVVMTMTPTAAVGQDVQPPSALDVAAHTKTVQVGDLAFPVVDYGEGAAVLLLHGFPDSRYLWRYQVPALAEAGFRVLAPDLRGFGDAPRPADVEAYSLSHVIEDLTGLLDTLGIPSAHVVGHDWGGTVAWIFAGQHPERTRSVTGLTVGAPGAPGRRTIEQLEKFWYVFFFQNEGPAEEWLRRDDWQGLRAWTRGDGDLTRYIEDLSRPGALTAALNWYRANFSAASLNQTASNPPRIMVPALGMSAGRDAYLLEAHVASSEAMIDGPWRYHRVDDASHWLMLDRPAEVNRVLTGFLREVEAAKEEP